MESQYPETTKPDDLREGFWMVFNPKGVRAPTTVHTDEKSALLEAKRVARLEPGDYVYVLRAEYEVVAPPVIECRHIEYF